MPQKGFLSGSRFAAMMTESRGKSEWGKTSLNLAVMVAAERLELIVDEYDYTNSYMDWGNEQEYFSVQEYQRRTFREIHSCQEWQQHPDYEWVGCTPDGLIGSDGLYETKSPKTENHLFNLLEDAQLGDYRYQIQGSLWVTGRKWCDFVSYDPRVVERLQLHIVRVKRDDEVIEKMRLRYLEFEKKVNEYKARLMKL